MNFGELPIFRAPDDKKVDGFSIVEDFFLDLNRHQRPPPVSNDMLFRHAKGIFQALTLLVDFGHLNEVNLFIRSNPLLLKTSFDLKDIVVNNTGEISVCDTYTSYSPLLIIAPYFVKTSRIGDQILSKRKIFYSYTDRREMASRYTRNELMATLSLWLQMGLDVIAHNQDSVSHSLIDLAIDMEFDIAFIDVIFKYSLTSPMYHDIEGLNNDSARPFRVNTAIKIYTACINRLKKLIQLSDTEGQHEMRYVSLLLNAYFKHQGASLFDIEKVKEGNLTIIKTDLEPYFSHDSLLTGAFGRFIEIVYIVLRGDAIFDDPHVLMIDTMKLLMEVHSIDPITGLTMVKNDEQRDILLDIVKGL